MIASARVGVLGTEDRHAGIILLCQTHLGEMQRRLEADPTGGVQVLIRPDPIGLGECWECSRLLRTEPSATKRTARRESQ